MTREEWDSEWRACFERLRVRGYDLLAAQRTAREITTAKYGPQPSKPLWLSLGLAYLSGKLAGLGSVEVSPMVQRIIVAVTYGIGAASPVLATAFQDGVITGQEWSGIAMAFFVAFWGTFKSNTTIISPNRTIWSPAERAVEVAKIDAGVLVQDAKVKAADKVADAEVVAAAKVEDAKPGK